VKARTIKTIAIIVNMFFSFIKRVRWIPTALAVGGKRTYLQ